MQNSLFRIVLLALAIFAIAFVGSPFNSYRALRAATLFEDVQATTELVDFSAVRKSLEPQLDPDPARTVAAPSVWQDPVGAVQRALKEVAPQEPRINRYLTVAGLGAVVRGYPPGKAPVEARPDGSMGQTARRLLQGPWPGLAYLGIDRMRLAVHRPGERAKVTILTFERHSLFGWKLTHIQLPEDERQ
ncbi:MAG: DUF2939 domain-containing protein [Caulobacter sp.]|nr:DUF2939 domain-containing protein [Caulobacter sp.]